MATVFISDLHLTPTRPEISQAFLRFLRDEAPKAEALYILGDLFEFWLGADVGGEQYREELAALKALADTGLPCYFMKGNRDFLVEKTFEAISGCILLDDPTVIDLYGTPTILMHGDILCTDDVKYQEFRVWNSNPVKRRRFLATPRWFRRTVKWYVQRKAAKAKAGKALDIMDVNQQAVEQQMRVSRAYRLIHGHTHRPATHHFTLADGQAAERIVMGDWYEQGSLLWVDADGHQLLARPFVS